MIIKKDIFIICYCKIHRNLYSLVSFFMFNQHPTYSQKKDVFFSWILTCNALIKKTKEYLFYILKYYNIEFEHAND